MSPCSLMPRSLMRPWDRLVLEFRELFRDVFLLGRRRCIRIPPSFNTLSLKYFHWCQFRMCRMSPWCPMFRTCPTFQPHIQCSSYCSWNCGICGDAYEFYFWTYFLMYSRQCCPRYYPAWFRSCCYFRTNCSAYRLSCYLIPQWNLTNRLRRASLEAGGGRPR